MEASHVEGLNLLLNLVQYAALAVVARQDVVAHQSVPT